VQAKVFEKLVPISDYLATVPDWVVGLIAMALVMVPIVAWRFSKLAKPEAPLLSNLLKFMGRAVLLASLAAAVIASGFVATFVGAHYFLASWGTRRSWSRASRATDGRRSGAP
jgi:hypothetical protein